MALEFGIKTRGTDDVPYSYSTYAPAIINVVVDHYGAGTPEVQLAMEKAFMLSFLCHIIIFQNQKLGTDNNFINIRTYMVDDAYMFTDCVDYQDAGEWGINILKNIGVFTTIDDINFNLGLKVVTTGAITTSKNEINVGLDGGELAACMNNTYSVGLDVSPYICDVSPCGSVCLVFDMVFGSLVFSC